MAGYCPNCGEPVADDASFCGECGTPLGGDEGGDASGWDETQNTGQGQQNAGWDDTQNTGRGQQNAGWDNTQGAQQGPQQPRQPQQGPQQAGQPRQGPQQAGPGMQGRAQLTRKNAIDTFVQGVQWLIAVPVLLGAFILVGVVDGLGQTVTGLFGLVGFILNLIVWGVAYRYTEQLAYGGDVKGGVDGVINTASEVAGRLLSLIGIGIIYFIAVFVGLIFLIIPGVYLGARLVLAFPACVLDGEGVTDSLSTSWEVAGGNVLKLVGLGLINFAAAFGISVVAAVLGGFSLVQSPIFTVLLSPVTAFLSGAVQMAVARVYLENRPPAQPAPGQPQGQQAGTYQQQGEY